MLQVQDLIKEFQDHLNYAGISHSAVSSTDLNITSLGLLLRQLIVIFRNTFCLCFVRFRDEFH